MPRRDTGCPPGIVDVKPDPHTRAEVITEAAAVGVHLIDTVRQENGDTEVEAHGIRNEQDDAVRHEDDAVRSGVRKENDEPEVEGHGVRSNVRK